MVDHEYSGRLLTPKQAAERIGVSSSLIYQLCHERVLPHFRFGGKGRRGRVMIRAAELDAFICKCRVEERPGGTLKHIQLN